MLPVNQVRVTAVAMGGCFGDGASTTISPQAAALMSQVVGAPVRVQLMRGTRSAGTSTSPASLMDVRAGIDAKGNLVAFDFTHFYPQYQERRTCKTTAELAGTPLRRPRVLSGEYWPTVRCTTSRTTATC